MKMSKVDNSGIHDPEKMNNRNKADCYVHNVKERKYYALSWQSIADAANEDEFLSELKSAMKRNGAWK